MKPVQLPVTQFEKDNSDLILGIINSVEAGDPINSVIQKLKSEQIDERIIKKAVHFVTIRLTDAHTDIVEKIKQLRIEKYSDDSITEILAKSENIKPSLVELLFRGINKNDFYEAEYKIPFYKRFSFSSDFYGFLLLVSIVFVFIGFSKGYFSIVAISIFVGGIFTAFMGKK